ncbi:MAG TPA: ABC transporter permease [Pirellulales bacterium]|jgi:ribose transport system permease protein|nr:ABC transporter permease [Pirellulales bacterium]
MKRSSGEEAASDVRGTWRAVSGALGPLVALGLVFAFFAAADYATSGESRFVGARNLRTIAVQTSTVAIAALGMVVIIISGGIDLSAGTALALAATVLAWCLREGYGPVAAVAACIGAGLATGFINGALVSLLRVVPFIITLGTMRAYVGIAKLVGEETTVRPLPNQIPDWLSMLVATRPEPEWLVLPVGVWLVLGLSAALAAVLRWSVFGRWVFAVGSSEATARLCGVNVPLVKVAVYTLSGFFVGMAGIYQFARLTSGNPTSGSGLELNIIAAVVIGGASLNGGRGTVLGTIAGAAMMGLINNGCTLLGVSSPAQDIIVGVIIVVAAALDQWRQRRLSN